MGPGWKSRIFLPVAVVLHHGGADHVGGHQVRRELNARILQRNGLRQRAHQQRLAHARNAFEQHVSARQQSDQHAFDHFALPHDRLGNLVPHFDHLFRKRFDLAFQRLVALLIFRQHCGPSFACCPVGSIGVQFYSGAFVSCVRNSAAHTAGSAPEYFPAPRL